MDQQYSSILLENAVNEFAKLPGIGRKTALRLVLHLLRQEEGEAEKFGNTIIKLCKEIKRCHICHNISDSDTCTICGDPSRDASTLCVVENVKEVMVVENTRQFHGLYHVLGGRHSASGLKWKRYIRFRPHNYGRSWRSGQKTTRPKELLPTTATHMNSRQFTPIKRYDKCQKSQQDKNKIGHIAFTVYLEKYRQSQPIECGKTRRYNLFGENKINQQP